MAIKKTEGIIYIILILGINFLFSYSLALVQFLFIFISSMLLLQLATFTLAYAIASTTAISDSNIPSLDSLLDDDIHNNEKRCADVDCLYRIRTTGSFNTKDFALYLGKHYLVVACQHLFFYFSISRIFKLLN